MKKFVLILIGLLIIVPLIALPLLGLSPTALKENVEVGTGMSAKLACSGRYLTGLDEQQVLEDLASYSPAVDLFTVTYDDVTKQATVSLFGMSTTSAQYREGLGCTLDIGDTSNLDELTVPPLAQSADPWPFGDGPGQIDPALQTRLDQMLARDNAAGLNTRGLVVIQAGQLIAESYGEGFTQSSPLLGWSMGKSLTSIMLGHMELLGQIDVAETNLFPAWQADSRSEVSIEHLLQMASGLDFDESYAPGSDATKMLFGAFSASGIAIASPALHPPGEHFAYSSGTTNMLARLMTDRLGGQQAAIDYLFDKIFSPLGMRHSTFETDPSGIFVGSSYIYSSPRDWARLGQLMLNRGELNGVRLLSEGWVARAVAPNGSRNNPAYGYQFWLNTGGAERSWPSLPEDAYSMSGNRQQTVMVVPSRQVVLVRLGWTSGGYPLDENFAELLNNL